MKYLKLGIITFLLTFSLLYLMQLPYSSGQINDDEPIIPSSPTNVFIIEEAEYDRAVGNDRPVVKFRGLIYWEQLGGSLLNFFVNTSDVIEDQFWDYESGKEFNIGDSCVQRSGEQLIPAGSDCVTVLGDRYLIVP
ncbi:MAG: hypothetical protein ACC656_06355, partial [Candidatus Heimdallarchaeota archaeon]